jgi:hypothetical protein
MMPGTKRTVHKMKKVFQSHSETCHVWASQQQDEGRGSNIFFEGNVIYSYGYHYKMACIHGKTVLINSSGYSSSTAKHTCHTRRAVSHLATIDCPLVDPRDASEHEQNIQYFISGIEDYQKKAVTARTRGEHYIQSAEELARDFNNYIDLFSLKRDYIEPSGLFDTEAREKAEKAVESARKAEKERNAQRLIELNAELDKWERGGASHYNLYGAPIRLRINENTVETSHGARVPIDQTIILLDMIDKGAEISGYEIGGFVVKGIEGDILTVGCHKIPMQQVKKIESLLTTV